MHQFFKNRTSPDLEKMEKKTLNSYTINYGQSKHTEKLDHSILSKLVGEFYQRRII